MSNAIEIVQSKAECYLLLYEWYQSRTPSLPVLSLVNIILASIFVLFRR